MTSLINLMSSGVIKPTTNSPDDAIEKAEVEEMRNIKNRLVSNPYADSDAVRLTLLGIQIDNVYKTIKRIEALLNTDVSKHRR